MSVLTALNIHWTWLILLGSFVYAAGAIQPKKLTQLDIAKLLRNLDRDSSKLVNGGEALGHTKPEKSEISEEDTPSSGPSGPSSTARSEALGTTTAIETGETYFIRKPIELKIQQNNENKSSAVFYSIKPEDDDWLKKKVEQIRNSNF